MIRYGKTDLIPYLRRIHGIMEIFSVRVARLKDSGVIDCAITRISSRIFLVDKEKALATMEKKKGGRNY